MKTKIAQLIVVLNAWRQALRNDRTLIVAIVMLVGSLIAALIAQPELPLWRMLAVVGALLGLVALNIMANMLPRPISERLSLTLVYLGVSSLLYLAALSLSDGIATNVIGTLIFLLIGQAAWSLPFRAALAYSALMLAILATMIAQSIGIEMMLQSLPSIGFGAVFVIAFVSLTRHSERQMERAERERARAETLLEQLQASHSELRAARERELAMAAVEERMRLARDIHDGLGHYLTALNVQLQAAARLQQRDPERAAAALGACREVAQAALDEVRRSVAAMQPSPLDGRSLDVAIERLVADFGHSMMLEARFEQQGDMPLLPPALAQTLYRAAQEGLTNAHKHGAATQVVVSLACLPDSVRLKVRDNGQAAGAPPANGGYGLAGVRERVERLGGIFAAGPDAAGGFLLEIVTPVVGMAEVRDDSGVAG